MRTRGFWWSETSYKGIICILFIYHFKIVVVQYFRWGPLMVVDF